MDVKFNSSLGFGAKKIPYTKLVGNYRKTHTVINPCVNINVGTGIDHNIEAVNLIPKKVLDSIVEKLRGKGLFVKPEETEATSVLTNLVCDVTNIGEEARKVFNSTVMKSYKTRVKSQRVKV